MTHTLSDASTALKLAHSIALIAALATLALAGCGGDAERGASSTPAVSSAVPFDLAFIDAMVPHHRSAIAMARAAKQRGLGQEELNEIADDILASQQLEIDKMLGWREQWFGSRKLGPVLPEVLGVDEEEMGMEHGTDQIRQADDVDGTFAAMMIPHHEGAVAMAEVALNRGQHSEISALAQDIINAQKREIAILERHATAEHHS